MTDPRTDKALEVIARICIDHGFDRASFIDLMFAGFGTELDISGEPTPFQVAQFMFASGEWLLPARTANAERRRREAEKSWTDWLETRAQQRQRGHRV